ncbi:MAG: GGDEF domain-containing protein [Lachnospiraceae bacterium]|nr:GGDEF domain-containing protein [Lachnospiraceae bacterium]
MWEKRYKWNTILIILLVTLLLIGVEYLLLLRSNETLAKKSAGLFMDHIERHLDHASQTEADILSNLKEEYCFRAKAVSYVLDDNPESRENSEELQKVARLMGVDEIHIVDATGTIISGTNPKYYGYNFDSGEQISYFKPMLTDKSLVLCQDMVPNTVEGHTMMYAATWNFDETYIVQVGIEPVRLLDYMRSNDISAVINNLPTYEGTCILVADAEDLEILATTDKLMHEKTLEELGIGPNRYRADKGEMFQTTLGKTPYYCLVERYGSYVILIGQKYSQVNTNLEISLLILGIYLVIAVLIIYHIIRRMFYIQENAMMDAMTGVYNRRRYESVLTEYNLIKPMEDNLVYVQMDLNGLKCVNDNIGHDAGDALILGASECMERVWGSHGELYRTGGDEFVAIVVMTKEELSHAMDELTLLTKEWKSPVFDLNLCIACGYARHDENPSATIYELAKMADQKMYEDKKEFYRMRKSCKEYVDR